MWNETADSADPSPRQPDNRLVPLRTGTAVAEPVRESSGRYPDYGNEPEPDLASTLLFYWRIFIKRRWLILAILSAVVIIGAVKTLLETPLYSATVRLQIDREPAKIVEGGVATSGAGEADFLRTQFELMRSSSVAERVVNLASLADDRDFLTPKQVSVWSIVRGMLPGGGAPTAAGQPVSADTSADRGRAVGLVMENLSVRPVAGSRLVDVTYTDPSPQRAQKVAAAFGEAFVASTLDKRFEANAFAKAFLQDQTQQLKNRLEESERSLLDFAQKEQIEVVTERASIAETNLAQANAALTAVITERIKNEQSWKQLQSAKALDLPQLLTNSVIDGLRGKRKLLEADYDEKLELFKPAYPMMVEIKNKMNEIDRQIKVEVGVIKDSYQNAYEALRAQEGEFQARVETLKKEVLDLQNRSVRYNILKREVDTNRTLYNDLLQRYKQVDIAGGVGANNVFLVERPGVPGAPSSPNVKRALMISLLLGLGCGLGAAYLVELLDDVVVSVEEAERLTQLASLGIIPKVASTASADAELSDPRSALSEAYRSLSTALQFTTQHGLPKSLLITSSGPGEGKSLTAYAVARHFALMGQKVLIIDADMRNPSLHKKIGADNSVGLSNYLTGACAPPEAILSTDIDNLAFMPSGPLPPNAADLLGGTRLLSLLTTGAEIFDLIMIDGPPVLGLADVPILANATEATVFVIAAGQSRKGALPGALRRIAQGRGALLGLVLTKFDARKAGYGYGYGYGYGAYSYGAHNHVPARTEAPTQADRGAA